MMLPVTYRPWEASTEETRRMVGCAGQHLGLWLPRRSIPGESIVTLSWCRGIQVGFQKSHMNHCYSYIQRCCARPPSFIPKPRPAFWRVHTCTCTCVGSCSPTQVNIHVNTCGMHIHTLSQYVLMYVHMSAHTCTWQAHAHTTHALYVCTHIHTHIQHIHITCTYTHAHNTCLYLYTYLHGHMYAHTQSGGNPDLEFMLRVNQIMIDFVNDGGKTEWVL